jgi:hypothetical protein
MARLEGQSNRLMWQPRNHLRVFSMQAIIATNRKPSNAVPVSKPGKNVAADCPLLLLTCTPAIDNEAIRIGKIMTANFFFDTSRLLRRDSQEVRSRPTC